MRGLVIAMVQVALVAGIGGKLLYDRQELPRVWAQTIGVDPVLPIRGRYVSLRLVVQIDRNSGLAAEADQERTVGPAELKVVGQALHATIAGYSEEIPSGWTDLAVQQVLTAAGPVWCLAEPIAFFLPEGAVDPTALAQGDELWAEVTVPPKGAPRPIRLEVRKRRASDPA